MDSWPVSDTGVGGGMKQGENLPLFVLALFFACAGALAFKARTFAPQHLQRLPELAAPLPGSEVSCAELRRENPRYLLVLGQSNGGNHGESLGDQAARRAFVLYQGKCYLAADPLPGGTGHGAGFWSRLPDLLAPDKVAFLLVAVESTSVRQWAEPGFVQWFLRRQIGATQALGVRFDLVLWQQGEADARNGTSSESYRRDFRRFVLSLRALGVDAPVMVAMSTRCRQYPGAAVRQALRGLGEDGRDVLPGPDTDSLAGDMRFDDCHFSEAGLDAAASLWAERLHAYFAAPASRPATKPRAIE